MILPLLDYSDIVWGDKHNKTLMAKVKLLQSKAGKLILDKAKHSSGTEAINELDSASFVRKATAIPSFFGI